MNRSQRRAEQRANHRAAMRHLRAHGCTCTPTFETRDANVEGERVAGAIVTHAQGCPLGERLRPLNNAGLMLTVALAVDTKGCSR